MDMKSYKDSTLFLLPLVEYPKDILITTSFLGTYIRDERFLELDNTIILEYSKANKKLDEVRTYGKIENSDNTCLYYMQLEDKYKNDYELFIDGKYSKLSLEAKQKITTFWETSKISFIYGVLYKTNYAKTVYLSSLKQKNISIQNKVNFEYWRIPSLSKETYKY